MYITRLLPEIVLQELYLFFVFCFSQNSALKDANRAISLAKEWPKGYFRKGRALAGLKVRLAFGKKGLNYF